MRKTIEASTYYDRSADLERITVPTLLVAEYVDLLRRRREICEKIKGSKFVESQTPVIFATSSPSEFNAAILRF